VDKELQTVSGNDIFFMKRALRLAEKAKGLTSPNPMVGAVLVKNGRIIAEDFHRKAGEPHAEALVLEQAQRRARNATLYVTLEPCCHTDKRTPPCSRTIVNAGIKKVFVAMNDPNPKVSGKGIQELRNHGIAVVEGLLEGQARKLNEVYDKYIRTKRPFVILKTAMTLDGKIATPEGQSKWITGDRARTIVHRLRCSVDAVMTAVGTVKADNPELTARINCGRQPLRIVIDPDLETPLDYKVCKTPPRTVFVTRDRPQDNEKRQTLYARGIQFIKYEGRKVDLSWLMEQLGSMGLTSVLIEAGSSFNAGALTAGIVDKVVFFIAPKIICGRASIPVVGGESFFKLEDALNITDVVVRKVGGDIMIEGYLGRSPA
jgi:diaminohydroxyphosphoribosylaminopyrimidine deaminase/5-amino-6-(5-phosphoribosylamino)uracil reductase